MTMPEGGEHLFEMITGVEVAKYQYLEQRDRRRAVAGKVEQQAEHRSCRSSATEHRREISADHVLHAMRQVDEVHHPEHQRQSSRDQEQQDSELQAVKRSG